MTNYNRALVDDCARIIRAERDMVRFDGYRYFLTMRWEHVGLRYIQVYVRPGADNYIMRGDATQKLSPRESVTVRRMMKQAYEFCNRRIVAEAR